MKKIVDYIVISSEFGNLPSVVSSMMGGGFQLHGNLISHKGYLYQALVKYEETESPKDENSSQEIKKHIMDLNLSCSESRAKDIDDAPCNYLKAAPVYPTLDLNPRAHNCLKAEGILTIGELIRQREASILKIPNLGKKSIKQIKEALLNFGLTLEA